MKFDKEIIYMTAHLMIKAKKHKRFRNGVETFYDGANNGMKIAGNMHDLMDRATRLFDSLSVKQEQEFERQVQVAIDKIRKGERDEPDR